jgi:hypothetical protein
MDEAVYNEFAPKFLKLGVTLNRDGSMSGQGNWQGKTAVAQLAYDLTLASSGVKPTTTKNVFGQTVQAPTRADVFRGTETNVFGPGTTNNRLAMGFAAGGTTTGKPTAEELAAQAAADEKASVEKEAMKNATAASNVIRSVASRIPGFSDAQLNEIRGIAKRLYLEGYDAAAISIMIEDSAPYQQRFIANVARQKNGDRVLGTQEYLQLEESYKDLIDNYSDLFPDSARFKAVGGKTIKNPEEFINSWLVGDVDPEELETRFLTARRWSSQADPNLKTALKQYYGIGEKEIAQWALANDEDKDTILRMYQTTLIGSEALGQDLNVNKTLAENIVAKDIGQQQARQAFSEVAKEQETYGVLSGIEGTSLTQEELIKSELDIDAKAAKKTKAIKSKEEARFSGSGAGTSILGSSTSGMI